MFMKQHQSIRTKIPGLGQRSLKTALAAVVLALVYYPLNREPTFACIGIIFGMGNNMEAFINWVDDMTEKRLLENWNVIAVGKGEINSPENNWHQKHFSWNTIQRSKVKEARVDDIRIQSLRAPLDLYRDIDISKIEELDLIEMVKGGHSSNYMEVRRRLGLLKTPQIMLYRIDKNSKNSTSSKTREDLNTKYDLAGIYISIPGGVKGQNYVTHLTIKIDANDKLIAEYDIGDD